MNKELPNWAQYTTKDECVDALKAIAYGMAENNKDAFTTQSKLYALIGVTEYLESLDKEDP